MRWTATCVGALLLIAAAPSAEHRDRVLVMKLDGAIQPAALRYLERGLQLAAQSDAELVVLELDTAGGLLVSLREMTTAITGSRVPVVVFVAPPGARAASAGFFLKLTRFRGHPSFSREGVHMPQRHRQAYPAEFRERRDGARPT